MHPHSYRYLSAILTAGSISKAAQTLGISQPSLSQFVQRIEKDLGAEVFDRSTRPLTLTESGRIFFEAEKRVAEIREDCRRAVEDIHGGGRGARRHDRHGNARETQRGRQARAVLLDRTGRSRAQSRGGVPAGALSLEGRSPSHQNHAGRGQGKVRPRVRDEAFPNSVLSGTQNGRPKPGRPLLRSRRHL